MSSLTLNQRVRIKPGHYQRAEQKELTFSIVELVRAGETEMAALTDDLGRRHKYFAADELDLLPGGSDSGTAGEQLLVLANRIRSQHPGMAFRDAVKQASTQHADLAESYISGTSAKARPRTEQVSNVEGDSLLTLANQIARERQMSLRDAIKLATGRDTTAVDQYQAKFNCGLRADR